MDTFAEILKYIDGQTPWQDNTSKNVIISQAKKAFLDLTLNKQKGKALFRICGQTGSGKTTQILQALKKCFDDKNMNILIIGVRDFAIYHPQYNQLLKTYGQGEIREKTNGFALKCLTYCLQLILKNHYMLVLDMTLLDPIYEKFILEMERKYNYKTTYHILAVNQQISNAFLQKRMLLSGRIVYSQSADYFYRVLNTGFKFICDNDELSDCFVWTAQDIDCVKFDKVQNCYDVFLQNQIRLDNPKFDENEMLQSKYEFIKSKLIL